MMTWKEIYDDAWEEESLVEILKPPTTIANIKADTGFNSFHACLTWGDETSYK